MMTLDARIETQVNVNHTPPASSWLAPPGTAQALQLGMRRRYRVARNRTAAVGRFTACTAWKHKLDA